MAYRVTRRSSLPGDAAVLKVRERQIKRRLPERDGPAPRSAARADLDFQSRLPATAAVAAACPARSGSSARLVWNRRILGDY